MLLTQALHYALLMYHALLCSGIAVLHVLCIGWSIMLNHIFACVLFMTNVFMPSVPFMTNIFMTNVFMTSVPFEIVTSYLCETWLSEVVL